MRNYDYLPDERDCLREMLAEADEKVRQLEEEAGRTIAAVEGADAALLCCQRILSDAIRLEMSPAAWESPTPDPYVHESGPVWEGLPGGHPLLPVIKQARDLIAGCR
jgi:hypothetical protein